MSYFRSRSRPRFSLSVLLPALALALTGCGDSDAPTASPGTAIDSPVPVVEDEVPHVAPPVAPMVVRYQCASDLFVEATYQGENATLLIDGEQYLLTQQVAASGVLYSDDTLDWHTKGDEAVLSGGDDTRVCLRVADDDEADDIDLNENLNPSGETVTPETIQ